MRGVRLARISGCDAAGKALAGAPTEERIRKTVLDILKANALCSLATIADRRRAHVNTAYFCYSDRLEIYFLSHPNSMHCRNLGRNPSAALAIYSSVQKWGHGDRGLQLFGTCAEAKGAQEAQARRLYSARFPAYAAWRRKLRRGEAGREYRFYRFAVTSLQVLDEKSLGDAVFCRAAVEGNTA